MAFQLLTFAVNYLFTEIGISLTNHFPLILTTDLWGHSSSPNKIVLVTGKLTQIK